MMLAVILMNGSCHLLFIHQIFQDKVEHVKQNIHKGTENLLGNFSRHPPIILSSPFLETWLCLHFTSFPKSFARLNFWMGILRGICVIICHCTDRSYGKIYSMLSSLIIKSINKMHFPNTVLAFNNCQNNLHVNWEGFRASASSYEWWKLFTILMVLTMLFRTKKRSSVGTALQSYMFMEN